MTMLQLNPPIPIDCPKGQGLAHFIIDYGIEHNLQWVIFIDETNECWTFSNTKIRALKNITQGRYADNNVTSYRFNKPIYVSHCGL